MNSGLCLVYLTRNLPALSETFVVRELAALRRLDVEVVPLSLRPGENTIVHHEIPDLAAKTEVLICPRHLLFWLAHLYFAVFFPRRYFGCLWRYVLALQDRRWRAALFFAVAPYAALTCRRAHVRHIHAHFANAATTVALMAAHLLNITFSFTLHSYYETFIDNLLLPQKLEATSFVVSVSQYFIDQLYRHYPEAVRADIHLIRCGLNLEAYTPGPRPHNSPPVILAVGRLADTKGFPTLIAACAILRDQRQPFRCLIIGDGPEYELLREMIQRYRLTDHVTLAGRLLPLQIKAYYATADVLALPCCVSKLPGETGNHDCLPYVLIEALAMGLPVISTPIGAIGELVAEGQTGLLVAPEDPAALAAALTRLLADPALAQRLARAGRAKVVKEFDVNLTARKLHQLFLAAVGHNK